MGPLGQGLRRGVLGLVERCGMVSSGNASVMRTVLALAFYIWAAIGAIAYLIACVAQALLQAPS